MADKIIAKVTQKPEIRLERRSEDVVNFVKEPEQLNKASKEYEKALNEVKKEAIKKETGKSTENKRLQKGLNKAAERLDQAIKQEPKSEKEVGPILEKTRKFKEELKEKNKPQK